MNDYAVKPTLAAASSSRLALLLIEDDAAAVATRLAEDGHTVDTARTADAALRRLDRPNVDAIVLDLDVPDIDGRDVLVALRSRGIIVPVLALAAGDFVSARIAVLAQGADDCLVKPFAYTELMARIRALVRRARAPRWAPLSCGGLVLDPSDLAIFVGRKRVRLSRREHALLALFLRRQGEMLSREEIMHHVFGGRVEQKLHLINAHIALLRQKLRASPVVIESIRGAGYRLRAVTARS